MLLLSPLPLPLALTAALTVPAKLTVPATAEKFEGMQTRGLFPRTLLENLTPH